MATPGAPLLQARGLTLHADGRCLLRDLDWQVRAGERWCLVGRNAVGKSSLLRALAGLAVPGRAGEVCWAGRPQGDWPAAEAAAWRAWMPQQPADRFALPVHRLLELSVLAPQAGADIAGLLAALDVAELAGRPITHLSGGERQRVALAQAAAQGAALLLLDEPIAFQDPTHQGLVARWLAGWAADRPQRAWVASSHDIHWVGRAATHVLALWGDGRWRAGPVAEMLDAPTLRALYGCDWVAAGGSWLPA